LPSSQSHPASQAWIVVAADAPAPRVWGLTPSERLERALRAAGVTDVHTARSDGTPRALDRLPGSAGDVLLLDARWIYDERLVSALASAPATLLVAPSSGAPGMPVAARVPVARAREVASGLLAGRSSSDPAFAGLRRCEPGALAGAYTPRLRRAAEPFLLRADAAQVATIERRIFGDAYKGITDLVTKYVWPRPASAVTHRLADAGVHPNWITAASWLLAVLAGVLFWAGWFGTGLVCAWLMTFLDTVDGKLARVTIRSTRIGHVLDHGLDIVHPPFWWAAWAAGLPAGAPLLALSWWLAVGGYVVGRLIEGIFLLLFKIELHSWTPLDSRFREITARRNPNLLLLTLGVVAGRPDLGYVAVGLWTLASIVFHGVRTAQAVGERRSGRPIEPWNARTAARRAPLAAATLLAALVAAPHAARADAAAMPPEASIQRPEAEGDSLVAAPSARRGNGSSRLPSGEFATELWDFTARFESGHVLVLQFLHTNIGFGDGNSAVTGDLVSPDGHVEHFRTGDLAGDWKLSPDGRRLELERALLDQSADALHIRFRKHKVKLDLRVRPTGPAAWSSELSRLGYAIDLIESAAPIEGTIWTEGMEAPLEVHGVVGETHRWFDDLEARIVQRRIELFSLDGDDAIYLIDALTPKGTSYAWLVLQRDGRTVRELDAEVTPADVSQADGYGVPKEIRVAGAGVSGTIRLGREIARYDPLGDLPAPIRAVVAVATRPRRIWSAAAFDLELHDPASGATKRLRGNGIGEVTFLNPVPVRPAPLGASPAGGTEEVRCASAS
jgi:hypothetical protein